MFLWTGLIGLSNAEGRDRYLLGMKQTGSGAIPRKKTANDRPTLNLISPSFAVSARKVGRLVDDQVIGAQYVVAVTAIYTAYETWKGKISVPREARTVSERPLL